MAKGIGGKYGLDQGRNPARSMFTSQQPVSPMASAPSSPRVSSGAISTVPATSAGTSNPTAPSAPGMGDMPLPSMQAAATPTYGMRSSGAVTNSNRIG